MYPETLQLCYKEICGYLTRLRPEWSAEQNRSLAQTILDMIDWSNEALMHKDLAWITKFYLNELSCVNC